MVDRLTESTAKLEKDIRVSFDKYRKEIEQAAASSVSEREALRDKIKELETDKEFISASLAQARVDIEMQTKARQDLFKKYQDSMIAATAANAN